ncbi:RNA recognition motif domain containing protein [Entamoeba marina]
MKKPIKLDQSDAASKQPPFQGLNLYVAGLLTSITEDTIKTLFSECGEIIEVNVMRHPGTDDCKGFAFVKFAVMSDGERAIQRFHETSIPSLTSTKLVVKVAEHQSGKTRKQTQRSTSYQQNSPQNTQMSYYSQVPPIQSSTQPSSMPYQPYSTNYMNGMNVWPTVPDMYLYGQQPKTKMTLYVARLPPHANDLFLYRNFAKFGAVEAVNCLVDPTTKQPKGFGFVTYSDAQDALQAMKMMNNKVIDGHQLKVRPKRAEMMWWDSSYDSFWLDDISFIICFHVVGSSAG